MFDLSLVQSFRSACRRAEVLDGVPVEEVPVLRRSRRYFGRISKGWASYRLPLSLFRHLTVAKLPRIWEEISRFSPVNDDHANRVLKAFSDECAFKMEERKDYRWALFVGINTAGAARRITDEEIVAGVTDWVHGSTSLAEGHRDWAKSWIDSFVKSWFEVKATCPPTKRWDAFVDDPTLWATSGSAPTVSFEGEKFRNKWAWAGDMIHRYGSVSKAYSNLRHTNYLESDASVALKEESTKVRLVIATPLFSHLRQSFIAHTLTNPVHLNSTLSHPSITNTILDGWTTLVGLDASRFDHNVPFFILDSFYSSICKYAQSAGLHDLATASSDELFYLRRTVINIKGVRVPYEKGILSGWRLTSLLDSLISQMVADFIFDHTPIPFKTIVQGDDMLLLSSGVMSSSLIIKTASDFGMIVNEAKSTTGTCAEFLKYMYAPNGVFAYPARALRAIYYANPWLPTIEVKSPLQVAKGWWTLFSRLLPFMSMAVSSFEKLIAADLTGWGGGRADKWLRFLHTPMCVGGGGTIETSDYQSDQFFVVDPPEPSNVVSPPHDSRFLSYLFGAYSSVISTIKSTRLHNLNRVFPSLSYRIVKSVKPLWQPESNHWKTFLSWLGFDNKLVGEVQPISSFPWPRFAAAWSVSKKIRWLLASAGVSSSDSLVSNRGFYPQHYVTLQQNWLEREWSRTAPPSKNATMRFALGLDRIVANFPSFYHVV